jgi:hypothetical protein
MKRRMLRLLVSMRKTERKVNSTLRSFMPSARERYESAKIPIKEKKTEIEDDGN